MYAKTALTSARSVRAVATLVGFWTAGCAAEPVPVQSQGYVGHHESTRPHLMVSQTALRGIVLSLNPLQDRPHTAVVRSVLKPQEVRCSSGSSPRDSGK